MICENNTDFCKSYTDVSKDNSTLESYGSIPVMEVTLIDKMCSSKPLTCL